MEKGKLKMEGEKPHWRIAAQRKAFRRVIRNARPTLRDLGYGVSGSA
jgi:hypothetical protein